jgi:hypothetical protein
MQNMAKMMMMMTFVKISLMKLKTGLTYMNIQENKILHLNCVIFFGPVKVLPLLDQMFSEVQGTFGMTVYRQGHSDIIFGFELPVMSSSNEMRLIQSTHKK